MGEKLGQHFLTNPSILQRIAEAVCPKRESLVIEIGPGKGALTEKLLERADRVIAVELDGKLAAYLRDHFAGDHRFEVVEADVLATDLAHFGPVPIAGNLPYYITSPILSKVARLAVPRAVFLMQEEVADRLIAQPGSRDYGYLTVSTRVFLNPRKLFQVKPGAFRPPPKVNSAVVELTPGAFELHGRPSDVFLRFLGDCFRHKRKTIRNNLEDLYGIGVAQWPEAGLRAEQIPLDTFARMFDRLQIRPK